MKMNRVYDLLGRIEFGIRACIANKDRIIMEEANEIIIDCRVLGLSFWESETQVFYTCNLQFNWKG